MKLFAIGDIHGHTTALSALLSVLPLEPSDRLVFLGDYVDKGPDVRGTLDLLCDLAASRPNTVFLRGNHDQMLIDAHRTEDGFAIWETLAGNHPLLSYGSDSTREAMLSIPPRHWEFLEHRCVNFHETEGFIFVHAGIRPDLSPEQEDPERLQWMSLSMALPHASGRTVICGHTRSDSGRIVDLGHTLCLDTGISKDGWLTALETASGAFWQADPTGTLRQGTHTGPGLQSPRIIS